MKKKSVHNTGDDLVLNCINNRLLRNPSPYCEGQYASGLSIRKDSKEKEKMNTIYLPIIVIIMTSLIHAMEDTSGASMPMYKKMPHQIELEDGGLVTHLPSKGFLLTQNYTYQQEKCLGFVITNKNKPKDENGFNVYDQTTYQHTARITYRYPISQPSRYYFATMCAYNANDSMIAMLRSYQKENDISVYAIGDPSDANPFPVKSLQSIYYHVKDPNFTYPKPRKHKYMISDITFLSDTQLISTAIDKTIKIWDIATAECSKRFYGPDFGEFAKKGRLLTFSSDYFLAAHWHKHDSPLYDIQPFQIYLYDQRTFSYQKPTKLRKMPMSTTCIERSSQENCFLTGDTSYIQEWDMRNLDNPCRTFGPTFEKTRIKTIGMYKKLIVGVDDHKKMHIWMPGFTQSPVQTITLPSAQNTTYRSPKVWKDNQIFIQKDGTLHVVDHNTIHKYALIANYK